MRVIRWLWWKLYYAMTPKFKDLGSWLIMAERTRSPWWKFKPGLYHNERGREWQICWSDESYYVEHAMLTCEIYVSQDTGKIIGLNLFDEELDIDRRSAQFKTG